MKHLKKFAVILMMLLLITTNFTASVYADDGQTADDTSTTAEFVEKDLLKQQKDRNQMK